MTDLIELFETDPALAGTVLIALAGVVVAIYIGSNRAKNELIDTQQRQNEALRQEVADNERRCDEKIADQNAKISELTGQVAILREQQGAAIGAAIAPVVAREVVANLKDQWGP